jgi:hypothetical protein
LEEIFWALARAEITTLYDPSEADAEVETERRPEAVTALLLELRVAE